MIKAFKYTSRTTVRSSILVWIHLTPGRSYVLDSGSP
jgi:hypothetical protein